jgi:guanylate cyclase
MLGIVFMVLTEMAIWARLAVAGCLVLFGLAVPFTVAMPPQDAFLGMVHIVIVYAAGWAAVFQVETSRRLAFVRELDLEEERGRTVALLRNMLPTPIADRLLRSSDAIAEHHPSVTVLFADLVGFTPWASTRSAEEVVAVLDQIFTAFDELCDRYGVEKIKTIGDAYMAAGGVPVANGPTAPAVVRLGLDMIAAAETITTENDAALQLRIGVHEGSVVAGVIGRRKFLYDLWGDTVNTAARVESHGVPGRVHITQGVADQLGDDFAVEERGTIDLKGKGPMVTHLVARSDAS